MLFPCPKCDIGYVELTLEVDFELRVEGVNVVIPQALIGKCNSCHQAICIGKEMKPIGTQQQAN